MTSQHQGFLFMALGFAVWMAALSMLYGVQATGCEFSWQQIRLGPVSLLRVALYTLFTGHMGALLWLLGRSRRRLVLSESGSPDAFLWRASVYLTVAAMVATAWIAMALQLPSICR